MPGSFDGVSSSCSRYRFLPPWGLKAITRLGGAGRGLVIFVWGSSRVRGWSVRVLTSWGCGDEDAPIYGAIFNCFRLQEASVGVVVFATSANKKRGETTTTVRTGVGTIDPSAGIGIVSTVGAVNEMCSGAIYSNCRFVTAGVPGICNGFCGVASEEALVCGTIVRSGAVVSTGLLSAVGRCGPSTVVVYRPFIAAVVSGLHHRRGVSIGTVDLVASCSTREACVIPCISTCILTRPSVTAGLVSRCNISGDVVCPLNVPVFSHFARPFSGGTVYRHRKLSPGGPAVLLVTNSFNIADILDFCGTLIRRTPRVRFVIVANEGVGLFTGLRGMVRRANVRSGAGLLCFMGGIRSCVRVSSLVIAGPNKLAIARDLTYSLPVTVCDTFPNRRQSGTRFLLGGNTTVVLQGGANTSSVMGLIGSGRGLSRVGRGYERLRHPSSTRGVFELTRGLYGSSGKKGSG